ncbi:phosphatase PAP2 family protein [Paenibacillaceae bacterium WGS1546]|uniref:phosphatase PAP2 family protein n=1 Tax=Cohnella sp. WGS1546 TaxID=3366810 RepID=UPI00372D02CA
MTVFGSMSAVAYSTVIAVLALIALGTGKQPFAAGYAFVKSVIVSRKYMLFLLAVLAILLLNKYELKMEEWLNISYDLTPALTGWEGAWPAWLQSRLQSDVLTAICAIFYLVLFQSAMIASVGIYTYRQNMRLYYALCVAILVNYLAAVPFYLFVPVNEVWYVVPEVRFLMLDAYPSFEEEYRALSGLNNCFPSLHTSLSVTLAILASRSGIRRWAVFNWINASVIIFSIFYLGIHWFSDMVAGVALAALSAYVGLKVGAAMEDGNLGRMLNEKDELNASRSVGS